MDTNQNYTTCASFSIGHAIRTFFLTNMASDMSDDSSLCDLPVARRNANYDQLPQGIIEYISQYEFGLFLGEIRSSEFSQPFL